MTDWKQAAITAGENEANACIQRDAANRRFWILVAAIVFYLTMEMMK